MPVSTLYQPPKYTRWHNPSGNVFRFDLYVGPDVPGSRIHVELKPGETVDLPSNLDEGIQQTRKSPDGSFVIVGGLCPQLARLGVISGIGGAVLEPANPRHLEPTLDPEVQAEKAFKAAASMAAASEALASENKIREAEAEAAVKRAKK